ncbi:hypothetical protein [Klenkia sp. PcliD-1-E]|uniref:hypothetical protein n=1 Tax=Klenkia sp. PcliD-1-E TaxID=2954492 RepID=UPI00209864FB|nr:hypothetical protein [Klenkia sp. PcliD-1-E]MCO7218287.1 hypothetical protein [Klenkia sp. PcliD-1-E]
MPNFRLVADHGEPAQHFGAADADAAESHARELSTAYPTAKRTGYRLEQETDGQWHLVRVWLPRRVAYYPGGADTMVPPGVEPAGPLAEGHRQRSAPGGSPGPCS